MIGLHPQWPVEGEEVPADGQQERSGREAPYLRFERVLRRSIDRGSLPAGTVLLEGHPAEILGSSCAPVRQALAKLQDAGPVQRFDGRGHLVGDGSSPVRRTRLSAEMLGIEEPLEALRRSFGWQAIHEQVERDIIHRSVFGRFRVNEIELARHFRAGRTVARDMLTRLQNLGIVDRPAAAAEALRRHLRSSCPKVVARLEAFRAVFTPPRIDYIS